MASPQEQVRQLADITQRDERECAALLEMAGGDFNTAVNLALDADVGFLGQQPAAPAAPLNGAASARSSADSLLPRSPQQISLFEELNRDLVADAAPHVPSRPRMFESVLPRSWLFKPVHYAVNLFYAFTSLFTGYYAANRNAVRAGDLFDPKQAAARFAQTLDEKCGAEHLKFEQASYTDCLRTAKTELRYMLVVVVGWQHQDTPAFLPWLCDEGLKDVVHRHNMVVWGGSLDTSEAYQVVLGFKATKYPFVALVGPTPKTAQSNIVVMEALIKSAQTQFTSVADLAHTLDEKAIAHDPKVQALRLDRESHAADREIRTQQDDAYQQSLARDRARQEQQRLEQEAREREQQRRETYAQQLALWKAWRAQRFAEPPTGPTCRVQIRTADGQRMVAKFGEHDTVRTIYEYVLCGGAAASAEIPTESPSPEFQPEFTFKLASLMPRTLLEPSPTLLKNTPEVWPNGSLIVDE